MERYYHAKTTAKLRQMTIWSSKFNWVERASAWDEHLDDKNREAQEKARRDMGERHAKMAVEVQEMAIQRLKAMKPEELTPTQVLSFITEATKLERVARGEPAEEVEQSTPRNKGKGKTANVQVQEQDLFTRIAEYIAIVQRLQHEERGVPTSPLHGHGVRELLASSDADESTGDVSL